MLWFSFARGFNFIFLRFKLIITADDQRSPQSSSPGCYYLSVAPKMFCNWCRI